MSMQQRRCHSSWQCCYEEALQNLQKELHRQSIRRHSIKSQDSPYLRKKDDCTYSTLGRYYDTSFSPSKESEQSFTSKKCSVPKQLSLQASQLDTEQQAVVPTHYQNIKLLNSSNVEKDDFPSNIKQAEMVGEKEDDMMSHWSNSEISVNLVETCLDNLLQNMKQDKVIENAAAVELPSTNLVTEGNSRSQSGFVADLEATWQLMDALKKKIVEVQNVVECSI